MNKEIKIIMLIASISTTWFIGIFVDEFGKYILCGIIGGLIWEYERTIFSTIQKKNEARRNR